jgi:hypothetical protein
MGRAYTRTQVLQLYKRVSFEIREQISISPYVVL